VGSESRDHLSKGDSFDFREQVSEIPVFAPSDAGGSLNNENETHTAYFGFNWQHQFESNLFVAGSFGFAYHTGNIDRAERSCVLGDSCLLPGNRTHFDNGEVVLGARILFRESLEIGYRIAQRHGLSVYVAHMSNASLFDEDIDGMNFVGLRYRYAFD
jgi:hypothetical protein